MIKTIDYVNYLLVNKIYTNFKINEIIFWL